MHTHTYICIHIDKQFYTYTYRRWVCICKYICMCIYICTHIHIYIYTYIHICIYTYTHVNWHRHRYGHRHRIRPYMRPYIHICAWRLYFLSPWPHGFQLQPHKACQARREQVLFKLGSCRPEMNLPVTDKGAETVLRYDLII